MAWYKTGTVSVTNNSSSVTGSGTDFISNSLVGDGFLGPDNRIYEITAISSVTGLTIYPNYVGSTASGQLYSIIPAQGYIRDLATQTSLLVGTYSTAKTAIESGLFSDGSAATPSIKFTADQDTGIYRATTNTIAIAAGGSEQLIINTNGLGVGTSSGVTGVGNTRVMLSGLSFAGSSIQQNRFTNDADGGYYVLSKSRGATVNAYNIVSSGDRLGTLQFRGSDGIGTQASADIYSAVDSTASAGIVPGRLVLATSSSSGVLTERMRITSAGNVGIGVTPSNRLDVLGTASGGQVVSRVANSSGTNGSSAVLSLDSTNNGFNVRDAQLRSTTNGSGQTTLELYTSNAATPTEKVRIDSTGNVGIGNTSPVSKLDVLDNTDSATPIAYFTFNNYTSGGNIKGVCVRNTTTTGGAVPSLSLQQWRNSFSTGDVGQIRFDGLTSTGAYTEFASIGVGAGTNTSTGAPASIRFSTSDGTSSAVERVRIDNNGNVFIGNTSAVVAEALLVAKTNGVNFVERIWNKSGTGDNGFTAFTVNAVASDVGGITYNRTGGLVAYNTTSDYRAKDIIGPVLESGSTIDSLKIYEGIMKGATQSRPMLIAHEAQEVAPYSVVGKKDAVNEETGAPIYQQMDVSSLVPLLIAEVQSMRKRIAELERREITKG